MFYEKSLIFHQISMLMQWMNTKRIVQDLREVVDAGNF